MLLTLLIFGPKPKGLVLCIILDIMSSKINALRKEKERNNRNRNNSQQTTDKRKRPNKYLRPGEFANTVNYLHTVKFNRPGRMTQKLRSI